MEKQRLDEYLPLKDDDTESVDGKFQERKYNTGFSFSILLNLVLSLLLLIFLIVWLNGQGNRGAICGLPSDILFGEIPRSIVTLENNPIFIDSEPDPWFVNETHHSPWDDLFVGSWVAFDNPSIGDVSGQGMRMIDVGADPASWPPESEGFGVAVMHQMHCVMIIKQALIELERDGQLYGRTTHGHVHHCVETLRQVVMCHGDLALEKPLKDKNSNSITGWGNAHFCRDWSSVIQAIMERRIDRNPEGWVRV